MRRSCCCRDLFDDAGANADRVLGPGPGAGGRIVVEARAAWRHRAPVRRGLAARIVGGSRGAGPAGPAAAARRRAGRRAGRPGRRRRVGRLRRRAGRLHAAAGAVDGSDPRPVVSDLDYDANAGRFSAALSVTGEGDGTDPHARRPAGWTIRWNCRSPPRGCSPAACCAPRTCAWRGSTSRCSAARWCAGRPMRSACRLKRQIAAGQPLVLAELMRPAMVQKGAAVLMLLDSPGIALTGAGSGAGGRRHRRAHPGAQPGVARGGRGGGDRARPGARGARARSPVTVQCDDDAEHARLLAPALACLLLAGCGSLSAAVGGRPAAGDDADHGSDEGADLAAGDHADAGARADAERGERAVAVRLARVLQGSARGAGRRHRHHPGEHERHRQPEERDDDRPDQRRDRQSRAVLRHADAAAEDDRRSGEDPRRRQQQQQRRHGADPAQRGGDASGWPAW